MEESRAVWRYVTVSDVILTNFLVNSLSGQNPVEGDLHWAIGCQVTHQCPTPGSFILNWIISTKDQSACEKKLSSQLIFEIEKVLFCKTCLDELGRKKESSRGSSSHKTNNRRTFQSGFF